MNPAPQPGTPLFWPILIVGAALFLLGLSVARRGFRPRRVGSTPHCPKCDYILTGLADDAPSVRCPECGVILPRSTIAFGERPIRRTRGLAGLLILLLGSTMLVLVTTGWASTIHWYSYRPTAWVIKDLASRAPGASDRAWIELHHRMLTNTLSADQRTDVFDALLGQLSRNTALISRREGYHLRRNFDALTPAQRDRLVNVLVASLGSNLYMEALTAQETLDRLDAEARLTPAHHAAITAAALAHQGSGNRKHNSDSWLLNYLGRRELAGKLAPADRARFIDNALAVSIRTRKNVIAGETIPVEIRYHGRGPDAEGWWSGEEIVSVSLDGQPAREGGSSGNSTGFGGGASTSWYPVPTAGKHIVEVVVHLRASFGDQGHSVRPDTKPEPGRPAPNPRFDRRVTLKAEFEALPTEPPDYIKWIDDPALKPAIARSLSVRLTRSGQPGRPADRAHVHVSVTKSPAPIAFDVIARAAGKEHPIGTIAELKDHTMSYSLGSFPLPETLTEADLIFRSSPKVARKSIDLYEAWKGELVLENVKIKPLGAP